jgi:ribokinase
VTLVAAVGDDAFGREALAGFLREGLDTRYMRVVPGEPSGVALILVDEQGENQIAVASGANLRLSPADVDAVPDEVFAAARVLLASLESPLPTVVRGLERARCSGSLTILNPAPADAAIATREMLSLVDVLTPNEHEAAALAEGERDPVEAARRLCGLGCGAVVVTLGAAGCLVWDGSATRVPPEPVVALDATAAGDAFNGALAVALAEGRSLVEAARWANRAAALAVTHRGAQPSLPRREEIDALGR